MTVASGGGRIPAMMPCSLQVAACAGAPSEGRRARVAGRGPPRRSAARAPGRADNHSPSCNSRGDRGGLLAAGMTRDSLQGGPAAWHAGQGAPAARVVQWRARALRRHVVPAQIAWMLAWAAGACPCVPWRPWPRPPPRPPALSAVPCFPLPAPMQAAGMPHGVERRRSSPPGRRGGPPPAGPAATGPQGSAPPPIRINKPRRAAPIAVPDDLLPPAPLPRHMAKMPLPRPAAAPSAARAAR